MDVICPELSLDSIPHDALWVHRRRYWDHFQELELPPQWKCPTHTAVPRKEAIEPLILPQCRSSCIVFVDGFYDEALSNISALPTSCVCLPMNEAIQTYGLILQTRQSKELKEEKEALAALNGALQGGGLFFYVPPDINIHIPVQVLSILGSDGLMAPRLQLFLGKRSTLDIVQTIHGRGVAIDVIDASLDAGARLQIIDDAAAQDACIYRFLRGVVRKDASLYSFSYSQGAMTLHRSLCAILSEEGASAEFKGLDDLHGIRQAHTRMMIEHRSPRCRSRQHFKKILDDQSRSSCIGRVRIEKGAQKADTSQLFSHLLLSDTAVAKAQPNLEVFEGDVSASHGATFSQPDPEELFYLRTRGLSAAAAKLLWMQGFCSELIDAVKIPLMREKFREGLR
ncbi:MAG: hypothetical protein HW387_1235 [Parachlamydiales bacterium]|nr:hypothetical protein [Parachlamydiales bacterium]